MAAVAWLVAVGTASFSLSSSSVVRSVLEASFGGNVSPVETFDTDDDDEISRRVVDTVASTTSGKKFHSLNNPMIALMIMVHAILIIMEESWLYGCGELFGSRRRIKITLPKDDTPESRLVMTINHRSCRPELYRLKY